MATVQSIDLITTDPQIRDGRPCIRGTGIRVSDVVVAHLFHHRSPDEISSDYDLSLAQVYAAMAYYYQRKPEMDVDIREQIKSAQELKEKALGNRSSLLSG